MSWYERYSLTSATACSHFLSKNYPGWKQLQEISSSASGSSRVSLEVTPCCSMLYAVWVSKTDTDEACISAQSLPLLDCAHSEVIFPLIQVKPLLSQLIPMWLLLPLCTVVRSLSSWQHPGWYWKAAIESSVRCLFCELNKPSYLPTQGHLSC